MAAPDVNYLSGKVTLLAGSCSGGVKADGYNFTMSKAQKVAMEATLPTAVPRDAFEGPGVLATFKTNGKGYADLADFDTDEWGYDGKPIRKWGSGQQCWEEEAGEKNGFDWLLWLPTQSQPHATHLRFREEPAFEVGTAATPAGAAPRPACSPRLLAVTEEADASLVMAVGSCAF